MNQNAPGVGFSTSGSLDSPDDLPQKAHPCTSGSSEAEAGGADGGGDGDGGDGGVDGGGVAADRAGALVAPAAREWLRVADAEVGAAGPLVDGGLGAADHAAPVLANWRVALEAALDGKGEREESEHCSLICARRAWVCGEFARARGVRLLAGGERGAGPQTVGC